jgi:hypothetical protein
MIVTTVKSFTVLAQLSLSNKLIRNLFLLSKETKLTKTFVSLLMFNNRLLRVSKMYHKLRPEASTIKRFTALIVDVLL